MNNYDAIVIGSGPAGQKAAIASAKLGKKVALLEAWDIGGSSLHTATIPSKTLRESILELTNYRSKGFNTNNIPTLDRNEISITDLNHRINWVKSHLKATIKHQLKKNGIDLFIGHGRFLDTESIEVRLRDGDKRILKGNKIFLATGSTPRKPSDIPFDGKRVLTSTDFLSMDEIPKSMIVIGAGIIGCEYASMMCVLGVKVTLIDRHPNLLAFLDKEIALHLQVALEENNLTFLCEKEFESIKILGKQVEITMSDKTSITADKVLIASGREANVKNLEIQKANINLNKKGYIDVSKNFQTSQENIYAIGDVIGGPCLASTAYIQGAFAANCAFSNNACKTMNIYPFGIYTIPEISYIGETEESLKAKNIPYEVGRAYFYEISRCIITGNKTGLCKLLFCRKNFTLLGAHIIGRGATEVIHIAQLAISLNAKIHYFVDHVFNFPTYAEMYALAARNGINKVLLQKNEENIV
ncbi:MAG: putative soluble pyridine nucleotide transhydrogenase [Chlamydiia bacterium]|nr:putative soluble pyridine nucleotide transhydrogenase [Chlamydiia bacterium]